MSNEPQHKPVRRIMINTLILIALLCLIAINFMASIYIGKAPGYELTQKIIQVILVWLIPYFGAFFFSAFLWFDRKENGRNREVGNNTNITKSEAIDQAITTSHYGND
jgi:hypothetical protein